MSDMLYPEASDGSLLFSGDVFKKRPRVGGFILIPFSLVDSFTHIFSHWSCVSLSIILLISWYEKSVYVRELLVRWLVWQPCQHVHWLLCYNLQWPGILVIYDLCLLARESLICEFCIFLAMSGWFLEVSKAEKGVAKNNDLA